MLRTSQRPSYTCWRCLSRCAQKVTTVTTTAIRHGRLNHTSTAIPNLHNDRDLPRSQHSNGIRPNGPGALDSKSEEAASISHLPIRRQLKAWVAQQSSKIAVERPSDGTPFQTVANLISRASTNGDLQATKDSDLDLFDVLGGHPAGHDLEAGIVGISTRQPGDLVELRTSTRSRSLAIYLGYFSGRHHFFTHQSRWIMSPGYPAAFSVAKFASSKDLEPVLAAIPMGVAVETYQQMQQLDLGPTRNNGAALLEKMHAFRLESERIHQNNVSSLDAAREILANEHDVTHLSLFEITDQLLPKARRDDGTFPPAALYSVLTALEREDIAFRPMSPSGDCYRQDYMFEILPRSKIAAIKRVGNMVREYNQAMVQHREASSDKHVLKTVIGSFIVQARKVVAQSRKTRNWTPYGILEPSQGAILDAGPWSSSATNILNFLEWWASHDLFDSSSRYHAYGSTILRSLDLYDTTALDQSTAWTFLQEAGIINPSEVPSRYKVRLPETTFVKGGGLSRRDPSGEAIEASRRADIAADSRLRTPGSAVFCIDAPSTILIDDGISLERTNRPEEFWIHIHAADPAAHISPKSELSNFMELIPENIYLPGHFQAMLPSEVGRPGDEVKAAQGLANDFSLSEGSPALTFSAKVNKAGHLLDYDIRPTTLSNVVYLDPDDVSSFCDEPPPPTVPDTKLTVGGPYDAPSYGPQRPMAAVEDLDQASKDDLLVLYDLAEALKAKARSKGAWPTFFPRPSVSVRFPPAEAAPASESSPDGSQEAVTIVPADPQIDVKYETSQGCSVVSNTMVLAGHIAAKWCSDRGIAIPFRRDTKSADNFDRALAYANTELYPLIKQGIEPSREQRGNLSLLIGGIELSSSPGPYFILGLDMYAKVTSPLRRYADLLAHWQIHAALAHERSTGRKISSSDDIDAILPYPRDELSKMLVTLAMKEKMAQTISKSTQDWIHMALIRGWRFEGGVPERMRFTVTQRWSGGLVGELHYFGLTARMDALQLNETALLKDICVGDHFEVELADVNAHSRTISVNAITYLGHGAGDFTPRKPARLPDAAKERGFGVNPTLTASS